MQNTAITRKERRGNKEFGSVESLAEILRPKHPGVDFIPIEGVIAGLLGSVCSDAEKVAHIRNALAAAELVRAELAAGR